MISDGVRPLLKNGMGGALILRIACHENVSHLSRVLGRFTDGNGIP